MEARIELAKKMIEEESDLNWQTMKKFARAQRQLTRKQDERDLEARELDARSVKPPFMHLRRDGDYYDFNKGRYDYRLGKFNRRADPVKKFVEDMAKLGPMAPKAVKPALPL